MTSPDLPFRSTTERTTNESEMNTFIKTIETSGLANASKQLANKSRSTQAKANAVFAQVQISGSKAQSSNFAKKSTDAKETQAREESKDLSTQAVVSEVVFMPMKSSFLQERAMKPTNYALQQYHKATTVDNGKKFMRAYENHIPFGTHFDIPLNFVHFRCHH